MRDLPEFDPIAAAFEALETGVSSSEVIQRFAIHAARDGRLGEFDRLLRPYDQNSGRMWLLDWLIAAVQGKHVQIPGGRQ